MEKKYPISKEIYSENTVKEAIEHYKEYASEMKVTISYTKWELLFSSSSELGDFDGEFINYLLSLHVTN